MIMPFMSKICKEHFILACTTITLILVHSPLFFLLNQNHHEYSIVRNAAWMEGSKMSGVLRSSELLRIAHSCCLAGILPMGIDILMDFYMKLNGITIASHLPERCIYLLALLIPCLTFLFLNQSSEMPGIYVVQIYSQNFAIAAVSCKLALSEFGSKSKYVL